MNNRCADCCRDDGFVGKTAESLGIGAKPGAEDPIFEPTVARSEHRQLIAGRANAQRSRSLSSDALRDSERCTSSDLHALLVVTTEMICCSALHDGGRQGVPRSGGGHPASDGRCLWRCLVITCH